MLKINLYRKDLTEITIENPIREQLTNWINNLNGYIKDNFEPVETVYVQLGSKTVRILNYAKDFTPLIKKQLTYTLKKDSLSYDATLILWHEKNIGQLTKHLGKEFNLKFRIELLSRKIKYEEMSFFVKDESYSPFYPLFEINKDRGLVNIFHKETNTYYYGVENLEPEEFIKQGHIFVQIFNKIIKDKNANLVHGAAIGYNNNGVLFCARGQRGKSTLTVLSMMEGFDYVSDDYLILERENKNLYSYPIYSIITLSPRMYNELYDKLNGCRFVSNNARKDKYVINIEKFHPQFKTKYPVNLCIFPEIVSDKEPSVKLCNEEEKGRAITQLIQSTVSQMQDTNDQKTILKLIETVKNFEFYKLNLCSDIEENTKLLRTFLKEYKPQESKVQIQKMLIDITFDIANILDSQEGIIYTMNRFATNIYENLINGVSQDEILSYFNLKINEKYEIEKQLNQFIKELKRLDLLDIKTERLKTSVNPIFMEADNYRLSFLEFRANETKELIKEKE